MGITTEAGSCVTASVKSNSSGFSSYVSLLKFLRTFFENVTLFQDAILTEIPHRNVECVPPASASDRERLAWVVGRGLSGRERTRRRRPTKERADHCHCSK